MGTFLEIVRGANTKKFSVGLVSMKKARPTSPRKDKFPKDTGTPKEPMDADRSTKRVRAKAERPIEHHHRNVDRVVRASWARATGGASPFATANAWADWATHLATHLLAADVDGAPYVATFDRWVPSGTRVR